MLLFKFNSALKVLTQKGNNHLERDNSLFISTFSKSFQKSYFQEDCLTLYQTTNLDSSKLKEFADDNIRFDENGRKLSKWVENTVGKGEIARYEQFLLFPQCFQKACCQGASKGVIVWGWVNPLPNDKFLDVPEFKAFVDDQLKVAEMTIFFFFDRAENTVGKGENAGYQHYVFFPQCFPKPSSLGWLNVGIVCGRVKLEIVL